MNGFIIEMTREDETARGGQVAERWIGISATARAMILKLPGERPSVVDRGPVVLARARRLGLRDGEVRPLEDDDEPMG
jgi:hypothetical protein